MNLLSWLRRRHWLSDTGLPVGDPETGSEDVRLVGLSDMAGLAALASEVAKGNPIVVQPNRDLTPEEFDAVQRAVEFYADGEQEMGDALLHAYGLAPTFHRVRRA